MSIDHHSPFPSPNLNPDQNILISTEMHIIHRNQCQQWRPNKIVLVKGATRRITRAHTGRRHSGSNDLYHRVCGKQRLGRPVTVLAIDVCGCRPLLLLDPGKVTQANLSARSYASTAHKTCFKGLGVGG